MTRSYPTLATALLALALAAALPTAAAQGLLVTTLADTDDEACDDHCSLREAVASANAVAGPDTVRFAAELAGGTIAFADGASALVITDDLVVGAGSPGITVDARQQDRVFEVRGDVEVGLVGLTITGGLTPGDGGGVLLGVGTLTLRRCTITGNEAGDGGGGLASDGAFTPTGGFVVEQSTVSDNEAGGNGGAILLQDGRIVMTNSTISGNRTGNLGGGLYGPFEDVSLTGSTVTRNEAGAGGGGIVVRTFSDSGGGSIALLRTVVAGNAVGGDPTAPEADCDVFIEFVFDPVFVSDVVSGLGTGCGRLVDDPDDGVEVAVSEVFTRVLDPALADNGGPTLTHALLWRPNNPALDIGGACGPTDQRGAPAPLDGPDPNATAACDAGAVEAAAPPVAVTLAPADPPVVIPPGGGSFAFTATLTNRSGESQAVRARTEAVLPDGRPFGPLLGPATVRLGAGQSVSRSLVQTVPAVAPGGTYGYVGYASDGASGGVAVAGFAVEKEAGAARALALVGLDPSSWPLVYAEGGAVAAGEVWAPDAPSAVAAGLEAATLPTAFALHAPRPNPSAGPAALAFDLPRAGPVRLAVYDVLGREVARLVDAETGAGRHAAMLDGGRLPAGTYLVRMAAGSFVQTRRLTLAR